MQRSYRTPRGTDLPLLNLRGREYLEVKYRLVWFREEHPDWAIETELLSVTDESAYARAVVKDESGRIIATSHKFESKKGFPDFIEKAETGSIGRALALIGYGTQFCADELDEGDRIVDSPVDAAPRRGGFVPQTSSPKATSPVAKTTPLQTATSSSPSQEEDNAEVDTEASPAQATVGTMKDPGDYRISFGKKYKGLKLKEIKTDELEGYLEWLEDNATKKGLPLSEEARFLKVAVGRYLQTN